MNLEQTLFQFSLRLSVALHWVCIHQMNCTFVCLLIWHLTVYVHQRHVILCACRRRSSWHENHDHCDHCKNWLRQRQVWFPRFINIATETSLKCNVCASGVGTHRRTPWKPNCKHNQSITSISYLELNPLLSYFCQVFSSSNVTPFV